MAQDRDRWHSWAIPIAIVVGGVALRFTDRRWLVDLLDVPGLSETGNFALGFVVGAGWYVFPLIVRLVGKLSGRRSPRAARATVVLSIFAALGELPSPHSPIGTGARTTRLWMIRCPASRQASWLAASRC